MMCGNCGHKSFSIYTDNQGDLTVECDSCQSTTVITVESKIKLNWFTDNREGVPPPKKIVFKGWQKDFVMLTSWQTISTYSWIGEKLSPFLPSPTTEIGKSQ